MRTRLWAALAVGLLLVVLPILWPSQNATLAAYAVLPGAGLCVFAVVGLLVTRERR